VCIVYGIGSWVPYWFGLAVVAFELRYVRKSLHLTIARMPLRIKWAWGGEKPPSKDGDRVDGYARRERKRFRQQPSHETLKADQPRPTRRRNRLRATQDVELGKNGPDVAFHCYFANGQC
jgi:hypothetical protein